MKDKYDATKRFDRVCFLLRKGDWDVLRVNHPEGVSAWIREQVAEHCDALIRERKKREKAQMKAQQEMIRTICENL